MCIKKILPEGSKRRKVAKKIYNKFFAKYSEEERIYKKWIDANEPNKKELEEQRNTKFKIQPKISIVVPVYNTPQKFFEELIKSLQNQTYSNWELCLADGSPEPIKYMQEYPKKDNRQYLKYFHTGVKINDSDLIYLHDDVNNTYLQYYDTDTNILNTEITNTYFNLKVLQTDFAAIKEDILIKKYTFINDGNIELDVNTFRITI